MQTATTTPEEIQAQAQAQVDQQQQQGLAHLLALNGGNPLGSSIYDVLYAGASNPSFPSGNVWQWPFGFGNGGANGEGRGL